jgi:putative transcriptional regulator
MSKKAFDSIMAGLQDALAYTKGDKARGRATTFDARELDVGKVRGKVGLSQDDFARAFGVSVGTLRNWEQKRVRPDGPARVLLTVIDRDPVSVLKALRIGPKRTTAKRRPEVQPPRYGKQPGRTYRVRRTDLDAFVAASQRRAVPWSGSPSL